MNFIYNPQATKGDDSLVSIKYNLIIHSKLSIYVRTGRDIMTHNDSSSSRTDPKKITPYVVYALYKFVTLKDYEELRDPLKNLMLKLEVRGTLLLAEEGINGTISGIRENMDAVIAWLKADERLADLEYKVSVHNELPFHRTKVKLKKEIVTMGIDGIDPNKVVGTYVDPQDWNAIISDPETVLIDTRNDYEYEIGTFKNALNPDTETFREFPEYVEKNLNPKIHKKVAMFCTGGIRCEKASSYMKQAGFEEVYHLKGGVLKYLEEVQQDQTHWDGECFVFDDRIAVNHDLEKGSYDQCHACRYPITEEEKTHEHYSPGVSCHRCYDQKSPEQKARFAEREKQIQLAKSRGEVHIGGDVVDVSEQHRLKKEALKAKNPRHKKSAL